ncbi:MAG: hypothetical protein KDI41_18825, partial [Pseudomonadales bacterium]|nr:hypothetical protein [Pseudomonadales bacterium]
ERVAFFVRARKVCNRRPAKNKHHISENPFDYAVGRQLPFFQTPNLNLRQTTGNILKNFSQKDW